MCVGDCVCWEFCVCVGDCVSVGTVCVGVWCVGNHVCWGQCVWRRVLISGLECDIGVQAP